MNDETALQLQSLKKLQSVMFRAFLRNFDVVVPFGFDYIYSAINQLEYMHDECMNDANSEEYPKDHIPMGWIELDAFPRLKVRHQVRITSYVIVACNISKTLERSFELCLNYLRDFGFAGISHEDEKRIISDRRAEMDLSLYHRNKIIAHNSFSDPGRGRSQDDSILQLYSLIMASGIVMSWSPQGLGLPSFYGAKEKFGDNPSHYFIHEQHPVLLKHIDSWCEDFYKLFVDIDCGVFKAKFEQLDELNVFNVSNRIKQVLI